MRLWRNRQTRTFEGRMGNHPGSSPGNRTNGEVRASLFLFVRLSSAACRAPNPQSMAKFPLPIGAVTGTVHRMEYRLVPILHPLHAIAGMILLSDKVFCAIAERQVPVYKRGESLSFFCLCGYRVSAALSVLNRQNSRSCLEKADRNGGDDGMNLTCRALF